MKKTQRLKNYLRSARKRTGFTQGDVAFLLGGRGGKTVSRYELFEHDPMLPAALSFQIVLGVPVHDLFVGIYDEAAKTVKRRAKALKHQFKHKATSRLVERKRESVGRILETLEKRTK